MPSWANRLAAANLTYLRDIILQILTLSFVLLFSKLYQCTEILVNASTNIIASWYVECRDGTDKCNMLHREAARRHIIYFLL